MVVDLHIMLLGLACHIPSALSCIMFVVVIVASSLVIRHDDRGLIRCLAVGGGIATDHVPCGGLSHAVG